MDVSPSYPFLSSPSCVLGRLISPWSSDNQPPIRGREGVRGAGYLNPPRPLYEHHRPSLSLLSSSIHPCLSSQPNSLVSGLKTAPAPARVYRRAWRARRRSNRTCRIPRVIPIPASTLPSLIHIALETDLEPGTDSQIYSIDDLLNLGSSPLVDTSNTRTRISLKLQNIPEIVRGDRITLWEAPTRQRKRSQRKDKDSAHKKEHHPHAEPSKARKINSMHSWRTAPIAVPSH